MGVSSPLCWLVSSLLGLLVVPTADLIQGATRPSTQSASLMSKRPVLRLVAETSQLPTLPHSVRSKFDLPPQLVLILDFLQFRQCLVVT